MEATAITKIGPEFVGYGAGNPISSRLGNLPFLSEMLVIAGCEGLERVSNIPQVIELRAQRCPNLRCVERLDSLHQLFLTGDMHGEDLDVYNWTW